MPSSVERRGSIGRYCHASVRGCVDRFSRTSNDSGNVRRPTAPTPRAMVCKVFHEVFSVFCMLVLPSKLWNISPFLGEMPGTHDETGSIGRACQDHTAA